MERLEIRPSIPVDVRFSWGLAIVTFREPAKSK